MKNTEVMTINPKVCVPDDMIYHAVSLMWDHDFGSIPVVRDLETRELVGVITDRDVAIHVVKHANIHPSQVKVSDCMSPKVISVLLDDPIEKTMKLMEDNKIRRIPVVDGNGSCVGIISQADLLTNAKAIGIESIVSTLRKISDHQDEGKEVITDITTKDEPNISEAKDDSKTKTDLK